MHAILVVLVQGNRKRGGGGGHVQLKKVDYMHLKTAPTLRSTCVN